MKCFFSQTDEHRTTNYYINEEQTFIIIETTSKTISQTAHPIIRTSIYLLQEWPEQ